ncbi:GrpB family protein [Bacillus paranthracis]|uniref:GrpB family protein n=1 Tax=Bacillus cereus group TaxID=86661 RepID=UPI000C33152E|nr:MULTISPECIES: GrpB family protein [Bacillus cereus group]MBL3844916.1 GrpB family protein [Bacillus cereus]MDA1588222.1 GrpB family protein [Bacillus cereus group sp. TH225LC]MDA1888785.1 GrpB family protein [Bacillus cereus group sp. BY11-1LC]MDA2589150.1 GrpB family protein [Bacillus cereus group sp. Bc065]MDK7440473.1 GrpB family protein [Bacillus paranthracis]
MKQRITIEEYNIKWESEFNKLQTLINDVMEDSILSIEHVGSTSIKGLAAKPILDIDIIIEDYGFFPKVVTKLEAIGYYHQAEWSYKGREAFGRKDAFVPWDGEITDWMEHHLYVCDKESEELRRHIAFRDYLREHEGVAVEYGRLKKELVRESKNRAGYSEGKTAFITNILEKIN